METGRVVTSASNRPTAPGRLESGLGARGAGDVESENDEVSGPESLS